MRANVNCGLFFPSLRTLHAQLTFSLDTVFIKQYSDSLRSQKEKYIYVCGSFFARIEGDDSAWTQAYPRVEELGDPFLTCDALTLIDPKSYSQLALF